MELYLVRHGIAEERSDAGDAERALTPDGAAKMGRVAAGLRKMNVRPDLILTSPLRRARETADILARGLDDAKVELLAELGPGHAPNAIVRALRRYRRSEELMLVGHQPDLGLLASFLLAGSADQLAIDFKKGGVACIAAELGKNPVRGTLQWLATPKLLRSL